VYLAKLGAAAGLTVDSVEAVIEALKRRLDFFVSLGCRAADHGFAVPPHTVKPDAETDRAFKEALAGGAVTAEEADAYKTRLLTALAGLYAERGVVMQLHLQVIRSISARQLRALGPNTGFDVVYDAPLAGALASLLNHIEEAGEMPKTILYSLNPIDYYPLATIMGCFQDNSKKAGDVRGKMQLGSAWWFCDHRDGMEEHLRVLANLGALPLFVGMLTDSRSFLSYPRHEYFRRILCNLIGRWVDNGEYPADEAKLTGIVRDIAFGNAKAYFGGSLSA
jgi:glucuronate isomerase